MFYNNQCTMNNYLIYPLFIWYFGAPDKIFETSAQLRAFRSDPSSKVGHPFYKK